MHHSIPRPLAADYRLNQLMTERLQRFVDEESYPPNLATLADLARFFRIFGDSHYATKVSDLFLPFLVRASVALDPAFVGSVRDAQQLQRYYIESIEQYVSSQGTTTADGWTSLKGQLEELIASNRFVASALETTAFPLVSALSPRERADLDVDLEQFDRASLTNTDRPEVDQLVARLLPTQQASEA